MARRTNLTHWWLVGNNILRVLAYAFILTALIVFISVYTIKYAVDRDCKNYYDRKLSVFGYWVGIQAGSTEKNCPNPNQT